MTEGVTPGRPELTILIPALNAASFIGRAIASALMQQGVSLEVLVIDDGSSDGTGSAAELAAAGDGRLRVVRRAVNGGPAQARNIGIDRALGDWIAVLDADDAFAPGRLRRLLDLATAERADIVADNFWFYSASRDEVSAPALLERPGLETLTPVSFVARARPFGEEADFGLLKPLFRRAFLLEHALRYPEDVRHGEDFLLILDGLLVGGKYVFTREPGYLYTSRDSGRSRTKVDYDSQIATARKLSYLPKLARVPELSLMLQRRASALQRLSAERKVDKALSDRNTSTLLISALRDRYAAVATARRLIRWIRK